MLATNRQVLNVFWKGTGNRQFNSDQLDLLNNLQTIAKFQLTPQDITRIKSAEKYSKITLLVSDVPFDELSQILEKAEDRAKYNLHIVFGFG